MFLLAVIFKFPLKTHYPLRLPQLHCLRDNEGFQIQSISQPTTASGHCQINSASSVIDAFYIHLSLKCLLRKNQEFQAPWIQPTTARRLSQRMSFFFDNDNVTALSNGISITISEAPTLPHPVFFWGGGSSISQKLQSNSVKEPDFKKPKASEEAFWKLS